MWTEEQIASLNLDQPQILNAVLASGCASLDFLSAASDSLDRLGPPHVGCFAMLPFPLAVSPTECFNIPTGQDGAVAKLQFNHFNASIEVEHHVSYSPCVLNYQAERRGIGTQVVGYITLWGRHLRYYANYLSCLGDSGLRRANVNKSLWVKRRSPAGWDGDAINSFQFEDELNAAIGSAFAHALSVFIDNYNVAALSRLICPKLIPGLFTMLAPGRVSYEQRPTPPLDGMLQSWSLKEPVKS